MSAKKDPLLCRGVSLSWLIKFTDENELWNVPTYEVVTKIVKMETAKSKLPYVSLLKDGVETGEADVFISHAWGNKFGLVVAAARKFVSDWKSRNTKLDRKFRGKKKKEVTKMGETDEATETGETDEATETGTAAKKAKARQRQCMAFVWLDVFAITQHPGDAQEFDLGHLESVIQDTRHTLVVLDASSALPLTRCWCVFEMFVTIKCSVLGKLQIRVGSLVSEFGDFVPVNDRDSLEKIAADVSAKDARATIASDKDMLLKRIKELNRGHRDGMTELNRKVKRCIRRGWVP